MSKTGSSESDLDQLREQFPSWTLGSIWTAAASGPDRRRLVAIRDGVILSAWDAGELAADIRREEDSD
jgi:hypothetical protein